MKVLFVVTAFYPEQAIGSIRVAKFAKYLSRLGVDVKIISLTPPSWAKRDETLFFDELESIDWTSVDQSELFKKFLMKARVAAVGSGAANSSSAMDGNVKNLQRLKYALQFLYTFLKAIDWTFQVRKVARKKFSGEKFDAVFTSYPSLSSPLAGIAIKKIVSAKVLVADFRDPINYGDSFITSLKERVQRFIVARASLVTFASQGVMEMVNPKRDLPLKSRVVYNGYDPDDVSQHLSPVGGDVFNVVYTGALYGGKRNIDPFFKALSEVINQKVMPLGKIALNYAGDEGAGFINAAKKYGLDSCVVDHGRISRASALELQRKSNLCLLATWNTRSEKGIITGKVFEFFMNRKPVLCIVSGDAPESEIKSIIDRSGAGFCFEEARGGSYLEMLSWMDEFLSNWLAGGLCENEYDASVEDFSYKSSAETLYSDIEKITA